MKVIEVNEPTTNMKEEYATAYYDYKEDTIYILDRNKNFEFKKAQQEKVATALKNHSWLRTLQSILKPKIMVASFALLMVVQIVNGYFFDTPDKFLNILVFVGLLSMALLMLVESHFIIDVRDEIYIKMFTEDKPE